jgi:hypothetical protein
MDNHRNMSEQTTEIQNLLTKIKGGWAGVSALPAEVKALREGTDTFLCWPRHAAAAGLV